jgi:two-component system response regulator HydG
MDAMIRYEWPGNVRELDNIIERTVLLARGEYIALDDLPPSIRGAEERDLSLVSVPPGMTLREVEKEVILQTLANAEKNRTKTAQILGISRKTLQNKLKEYGLREEEDNQNGEG